nr:MAG TPA: hypothetical protein [Caudoviricetes sp.]
MAKLRKVILHSFHNPSLLEFLDKEWQNCFLLLFFYQHK